MKMTPKRELALTGARQRSWRTCPELAEYLGCTHTEANRIIRDLVQGGKLYQEDGTLRDGKTRLFQLAA